MATARAPREPLASVGRARVWLRQRVSRLFGALGALALLVAAAVLAALFLDLIHDGWARLGPDFLLAYPSRHAEHAGILPAWVGSLLVVLVTAASAIPIGVAAAVYLEEYAPRNLLTELIEINVTNLAAVPSIVYGLLALGLFVQRMRLGESVLAAGLTLGLLTLPIVIVTAREAIRAVPQSVREASYALGATRWQTVRHHVLPCALGGILTGVIVGLARALGETAPLITVGALTFIAFLPDPPVTAHPPFVSFAWLRAPFTTLPIQMFNWVSRPGRAFQANAAAAGVVLIVLTLLLNGLAIALRARFQRRIRW